MGFRMAGVDAGGPQELTAIRMADRGVCWVRDDRSKSLWCLQEVLSRINGLGGSVLDN